MSKEYLEAKNTKELCQLLGLPASEAPKIEIRKDLFVAIKKTIEKQKLTHQEAAEKTSVGRTVITAIVNGNLKKISTDRLLDIAAALGLSIKVKVA